MTKNPVILVHGFFIKKRVFRKMSAYLKSLGWEVYTFDLEVKFGFVGLEKLGQQLADYIDNNFPNSQQINLVGLSMGGLVSRYYIQRLGGINRVKKFISVSSPHQGTWMAYTLPCTTCVQMRPGSDFLEDLNQDVKMLEKINYTCLWTPIDFIIVPATSSLLGIGKEVKVSVYIHAMMARNLKSLEAIAEALSASY